MNYVHRELCRELCSSDALTASSIWGMVGASWHIYDEANWHINFHGSFFFRDQFSIFD